MLKAHPLECVSGVASCACGFRVPCRNVVMHVCHQSQCGPGCHLKRLLKDWLGFESREGCKCDKRARVMDVRGADWCLENVDKIVGWLREEHQKRETMLPFSEVGARVLIRTAIRNARRTMNS